MKGITSFEKYSARPPAPKTAVVPPTRPAAAVVQKAAQRPPVAAQNRGGDIGLRVGGQARDQIFDEPGGRQRRVALQVDDHVIAGQ